MIRGSLAGKWLAAIAAAGLALGVGSAVATATTGSPSPAVWGQHVKAMVEACKDQRDTKTAGGSANGSSNGIGQCVSAMARTHGEAQQASKDNDNDCDEDNGSDRDHANDNDRAQANDNDRDEDNDSDCDEDNGNDRDDSTKPSPAHSAGAGIQEGSRRNGHSSGDGKRDDAHGQ